MQLRVIIADYTGAKTTPVELPDDVPMKRLVPALAHRMSLPAGSADNRIVYHLDHKKSGRRLGDEDTLRSAGIAQDDVLRMVPSVTAGGSPAISILHGNATTEPSPPTLRLTAEDIDKIVIVIRPEDLRPDESKSSKGGSRPEGKE